MSTETLVIIAIGLGIVSIVLNLLTLTRMKKGDSRKEFKELEKNIADNSEKSRASTLDFLQRQLKQNADAQADLQSRLAAADDRRFSDFRENTAKNIEDLRKTVAEFSNSMDKRFKLFSISKRRANEANQPDNGKENVRLAAKQREKIGRNACHR